MSGEIGHVIYAARIANYLGNQVDHPVFWVGTLFPNIKHLGAGSRQLLHAPDVTLATLAGASNFATGMRVHSWIDLTREQWLREMNAKELLPWHPLTPFALQLVEDELLYEHFDDWNLIMRLLHRTHDEEIKYVDSRQHLSAWHSLLQQYFKRKPDDESRRQFTMDIGLSEQTATEINQAVRLLAKNKPALKLIDQFILHLEELLR